jgi:hypothetical protein
MKKLLSLVAIVVAITTTSFANVDPVPTDKKFTEALTRHFKSAEGINWVQSAQVATATFQFNGQYISAHFDTDATLLGVSRNITTNDLPLSLRNKLASYLKTSWVTNAFEYASSDADSYYITLENADNTLILKGEAGSFSVYRKTSKED